MFLISWRNWSRFVWEEACRWSSAAKEMNTDEWPMHELSYFVFFFNFGKDIVHINFFPHEALSSVWRYIKRNVHVKNAILILSAFMSEECWPVNCKGRKTRKLKRRFQHIIYLISSSEHTLSVAIFLKPVFPGTKVVFASFAFEKIWSRATFQSWKKADWFYKYDPNMQDLQEVGGKFTFFLTAG